jgi:hypothetical protein
MKDLGRLMWLSVGLVLGVLGAAVYLGQDKPALAAANDRFEGYILCTGAVAQGPRVQTDGVWLLDHSNGRLLGTVINRDLGKITGWAELDLIGDFGLAPRQVPHFLMTTGHITQGQAALYVAETGSGKIGVYSMGPRPDGQPGVVIRRHDLTTFRKVKN